METEAAVQTMLEQYSGNQWFLLEHWPVNEPRIRRIAGDLVKRFPARRAKVLDLGCFNGYLSLLLSGLEFRVTAADAHKLPEVDGFFGKHDIDFLQVNLNDRNSLSNVEPETFDAIVMGEILEHVLNAPLGLLQNVFRITKPGGLLVLTTPNPSNVMNAIRVLRDRPTLWGTTDFFKVPKIDQTGVICQADIHYREYRAAELRDMVSSAGFRVIDQRFIAFGGAARDGLLKRTIKRNPLLQELLTRRLFASTQYLVAERP
jgi:2-polyprenyl-3-methyl-5-hydroxy-6-metoxy-1,4-benzoquinol methylase